MVFDLEANKTVGLVRTLLEERARPTCDVFWNNEVAHTIRLAREGVLAPYVSPKVAGIPGRWRGPDAMWTGFAARARVLIVNTELVPDPDDWPKGLADFEDPKWQGKAVMAQPLAGTTATHISWLFEAWGEAETVRWLNACMENGTAFVSGNAQSMLAVADGRRAFGLTDTDDFESAKRRGAPVAAVYPDAAHDGTLVIPNTVAVIKGGPHPEAAHRLVDYILSESTERVLALGNSAQIPLRPGVPVRADFRTLATFDEAEWDPHAAADRWERHRPLLESIFLGGRR